MYLRVVRDRESGRWDTLDQPDDEPRASEDVCVYAMVPETWSLVFVRPGGRYEMADYTHVEVDGEQFRGRSRWREWAVLQPRIKAMSDRQAQALDYVRGLRERLERRGGG